MPYVINNTNGTRIFYVGDESFNTETAVTLPGRNVPDYGEPVDTNFIHMLENFANDTPPLSTVTLTGQLWYDTSDGIFKVYDGTSWVQTGKVPVSELPPTGNQADGNFYFDESIRKLKIYYQNSWFDTSYAGEVSTSYNTIGQGSPSLYGSRIRNIFLRRQSDNRDVPVLGITQSYDGLNTIDIENGTVATKYGQETLIGVMSRNDEFVALDVVTNSEEEALNFWDELNEPGGIGTTIKPGLNVRKDATAEYPIASLAQRAQTSYALNLGSYGADGANIMAANVFHHGANAVPVANLTYNLGSDGNVWAYGYINNLFLANALLPMGDNVSIGTDDNPIENIYVTNIEVDGNLIIEGDNVSIGGNTAPVDSIFVNEAYVYETLSVGNIFNETNYVFPSSRSGNSRLVCDDEGILYWLDNGALYTNITANPGITVATRVEEYGGLNGEGVYNREASIGAFLGRGLSFDGQGAIQVNFGDFTTCDITEGQGCGKLFYTDQRVFNFLEVAVAPPVETGLQAIDNGNDDYTLRIHGGAKRVVGTVKPVDGSPVKVTQIRTGLPGDGVDNFGFSTVEIDVDLGPSSAASGVTQLLAGTGLKNTSGELGLDWLRVADNLFTNDTNRLSQADQGLVKGTIGIKRVATQSDQPATHVIYVDSISSIGGSSADKIMFTDKTNAMNGTQGRIVYGSSTNQWTLGTGTTGSRNFNSSGRIRHNGSMFLYTGGTNNNGSLEADGDVTAFRQNTASDARLKKNISTIDNGLEKVNAMRGVSYELLRDSTRNVGVIAQEMEEVVPEVVTERSDGMKTVNYGALVGVLIEAVKELTQEVETLKAKLGD